MGMEDDRLRVRVRQLMGRKSIRQTAIDSGLPDSTLRTWLNKPSQSITIENLAKLATGLGVGLWSLFPDAPEEIDDRSKAFLENFGNLLPASQKQVQTMMEHLAQLQPPRGGQSPEEPHPADPPKDGGKQGSRARSRK